MPQLNISYRQVKILGKLADKIDVKGLDRTVLSLCRVFYLKYPQICETVSHKFETAWRDKGIATYFREYF